VPPRLLPRTGPALLTTTLMRPLPPPSWPPVTRSPPAGRAPPRAARASWWIPSPTPRTATCIPAPSPPRLPACISSMFGAWAPAARWAMASAAASSIPSIPWPAIPP